MLSFRVGASEAARIEQWAADLGVDRSELLRDAVRLHLNRLASEADGERWAAAPLGSEERSIAEVAEWGPAEDWADWVPTDGVVNFDNIHTVARPAFRRRVATLPAHRMAEACRVLQAATGC